MFSLTSECQILSLQYKCYDLYQHKGYVPSKGLDEDEEGFTNELEIQYIVMKTQVGDWSGNNKCREEKKRGGREGIWEGRVITKSHLKGHMENFYCRIFL